MAHRRMKGSSEGKPQADAVDLSFELLGSEINSNTESLKQIEAARCGRGLAVAVFAHRRTSRGGHERCHRRDVERMASAARGTSNTNDVDRIVGHCQRGRGVEHGSLKSRQFVHRLALDPQTDNESGDLRVG